MTRKGKKIEPFNRSHWGFGSSVLLAVEAHFKIARFSRLSQLLCRFLVTFYCSFLDLSILGAGFPALSSSILHELVELKRGSSILWLHGW